MRTHPIWVCSLIALLYMLCTQMYPIRVHFVSIKMVCLLFTGASNLSHTVTIGEQYHMAKSALSHAQSITRTPGTIRIIFTISIAHAARVPFILRHRRLSATHMLRIFRLTLREMFPLSASSFPRLFLSAFHSVSSICLYSISSQLVSHIYSIYFVLYFLSLNINYVHLFHSAVV